MTCVYLSEDIKPIETKRSRVVTRGWAGDGCGVWKIGAHWLEGAMFPLGIIPKGLLYNDN